MLHRYHVIYTREIKNGSRDKHYKVCVEEETATTVGLGIESGELIETRTNIPVLPESFKFLHFDS